MKKLLKLGVLMLLCLQSVWASTPVKITFWHSMGGNLAPIVNHLVDEFNRSQTKYKVVPVYKGSYPETLTALVAAFRAGQAPDIVQVFEVGTAIMSNPKGVIIPVYQLMQNAKINLSAKSFLPAIASYYSNAQGQLLAMPFNSSTPVMFYNKQAFMKAGLNPNNPPKTWPEMKKALKALTKAGFKCGFTTGWPSWIQLEAFSVWNHLPFATHDNGIGSVHTQSLYNNPTVIKQVNMLAHWQKKHWFVYGGRQDNAMGLFTSDQCPILMESSGSLTDLKNNVDFPMGVGSIPYWPNLKGAPSDMLIGGAALWAIAGHSKVVNIGIAKFFAFLAKPQIQAYWQQKTGYLPVTRSAFVLSQKQGYYKKYPGALVAIHQLEVKNKQAKPSGIRLGAYPQIRMLNDEALEAVFSGETNATKALNKAVKNGNQLLKAFSENIAS